MGSREKLQSFSPRVSGVCQSVSRAPLSKWIRRARGAGVNAMKAKASFGAKP